LAFGILLGIWEYFTWEDVKIVPSRGKGEDVQYLQSFNVGMFFELQKM
jgi:hypothetical protein